MFRRVAFLCFSCGEWGRKFNCIHDSSLNNVCVNSSHPTQPHSVIANYDNDHFVDEVRLQTLISAFGNFSYRFYWLKCVNSTQNDTKIALTVRGSRSLLKYNHLCSQLRSPSTLACKYTRKILQCHCSLHWHHSCALLLYTRLPL